MCQLTAVLHYPVELYPYLLKGTVLVLARSLTARTGSFARKGS